MLTKKSNFSFSSYSLYRVCLTVCNFRTGHLEKIFVYSYFEFGPVFQKIFLKLLALSSIMTSRAEAFRIGHNGEHLWQIILIWTSFEFGSEV